MRASCGLGAGCSGGAGRRVRAIELGVSAILRSGIFLGGILRGGAVRVAAAACGEQG